MRLLSQRDPKWAAVKLGASSLTIGRYGCTTTALCMLADYFGTSITPDVVAKKKPFYTAQGLILWDKLKIPGVKFERREYGRNDANILAALKDPKRGVLLEVNKGQHWVLATNKSLFGNSYTVADPWMGDKCDVIKRYHDITGAAYFSHG